MARRRDRRPPSAAAGRRAHWRRSARHRPRLPRAPRPSAKPARGARAARLRATDRDMSAAVTGPPPRTALFMRSWPQLTERVAAGCVFALAAALRLLKLAHTPVDPFY